MKQVLAQIEELTRAFADLTYIKLLEQPGTRSDIEIMGKGLAFFIMGFQDMLRLNAASMTDPMLAQIATGQRHDDAGHDVWFVNDLLQLNVVPDMRWLFGKEHQQTRDTAYEIMADILRAESDHARLAVGLALEATGGVYFSRVYKFIADLGLERGLLFFSKHHWDVEQSHEVFGSETQQQIDGIQLTPRERAQATAAAERTFQAVTRMCEDLSRKMLAARKHQGFGSALRSSEAPPSEQHDDAAANGPER
ncbi:MAG TPA: hypothetical protein VMG12_37180 [Polyangiaceae bacterium]|nr:hypothetical protein [Polyangiaceae bacterium]